MKCGEICDISMNSCTYFSRDVLRFNYKFCQRCSRNENTTKSADPKFTCPCCYSPCYEYLISDDEAILVGEASFLFEHIYPQLLLPQEVEIADEKILNTTEILSMIAKKLEAALQMNPTNFDTLYLLFLSWSRAHRFLVILRVRGIESTLETYRVKIYDYSYKLLGHPAVASQYGLVRGDCYYELATIFYIHHNYPSALKYSKLAYEHCLRSSDHKNLSVYKSLYLKSRGAYNELPLLRFAVGVEVELFCNSLGPGFGDVGGGTWMRGKVVDLYFRERYFDTRFTAPYLVKFIDSDQTHLPLGHAWVQADLGRYIRKPGIRSFQDTRYQARLDCKVEELAGVLCSEEFIQRVSPGP